MRNSLCRKNAILSYVAAADLTGLVGRFVVIANTNQVAVLSSATVKPLGVLLTEGKAGERVSVAVGVGGLAGTVRVRLSAVVTGPGIYLQTAADGRVLTGAGTGARTFVAMSLESGAADELVEAVLICPQALT